VTRTIVRPDSVTVAQETPDMAAVAETMIPRSGFTGRPAPSLRPPALRLPAALAAPPSLPARALCWARRLSLSCEARARAQPWRWASPGPQAPRRRTGVRSPSPLNWDVAGPPRRMTGPGPHHDVRASVASVRQSVLSRLPGAATVTVTSEPESRGAVEAAVTPAVTVTGWHRKPGPARSSLALRLRTESRAQRWARGVSRIRHK
jgi:hypothetical protein